MRARVLQFRRAIPARRSRIGTSPMRPPGPTLQGVIRYLDNCARIADFSHNLGERRHYQACAEFVLEFTHGKLPCRRPLPRPQQAEEPTMPKEIPPWKAAVLARPMRKVLDSHIETRGANGHGTAYRALVIDLECGHTLEEFQLPGDNTVPRRRRCKQCALEAAAKSKSPDLGKAAM